MESTTTPHSNYRLSSTGMLHVAGCGSVSLIHGRRSAGTEITDEAAAKILVRCRSCNPRPLGTVVDQSARPTRAAQTAATLAAHTPQTVEIPAGADQAIRAFAANPGADTFQAMTAACGDLNPWTAARILDIELPK